MNQENVEKIIKNIYADPNMRVCDIHKMKTGMTNNSYVFSCGEEKYVLRIPGEGTDRIIKRKNEYEVYQAIKGKNICDSPLFFDPDTGYKVTRFVNGARTCNAYNWEEIKECMKLLKRFHDLKIRVGNTFDLYAHLEYYEKLREKEIPGFADYDDIKQRVYTLKSYIDHSKGVFFLTHIDAVSDNFLYYRNQQGEWQVQLTDWEYAGMQDQHLDVAMFCLYNCYSKEQIDQIIDLYFGESKCDKKIRAKIYCYISLGGLLWFNWCEFKKCCGIDLGDYTQLQYDYAKSFSEYATKMIELLNC